MFRFQLLDYKEPAESVMDTEKMPEYPVVVDKKLACIGIDKWLDTGGQNPRYTGPHNGGFKAHGVIGGCTADVATWDCPNDC